MSKRLSDMTLSELLEASQLVARDFWDAEEAYHSALRKRDVVVSEFLGRMQEYGRVLNAVEREGFPTEPTKEATPL